MSTAPAEAGSTICPLSFTALGPGESTGETHLYVYDVELRTAPRQLTFEATQGWPVWSPDGRRLAYNSSPERIASSSVFISVKRSLWRSFCS